MAKPDSKVIAIDPKAAPIDPQFVKNVLSIELAEGEIMTVGALEELANEKKEDEEE